MKKWRPNLHHQLKQQKRTVSWETFFLTRSRLLPHLTCQLWAYSINGERECHVKSQSPSLSFFLSFCGYWRTKQSNPKRIDKIQGNLLHFPISNLRNDHGRTLARKLMCSMHIQLRTFYVLALQWCSYIREVHTTYVCLAIVTILVSIIPREY